MGSEIYSLAKFVQEKKIKDGDEIKKEELFSFLLTDTRLSPHTIRIGLSFCATLGFLKKINSEVFVLNKIKLDEFLKRDE